MKVVFDAGVVFSAAGWRGEAHRCLLAMAHRQVMAYATAETLKELRNLLEDRGHKVKYPPGTTLNWYYDRVKLVEPAPLGKQRSRDAKDDPYLACALAQYACRRGESARAAGPCTPTLSVLAKEHTVPFYVAAPLSTVDRSHMTGATIPIEERAQDEVTSFAGVPTAPPGARAGNPAFDVTPAANITAIVTEVGVLRAPYGDALRAACQQGTCIS